MQASIIISLSLLGLVVNAKFALSILLGGLICLIGNLPVLWQFLNSSGKQKPNDILKKIYCGQVYKLVLVGTLFGVVIIHTDDLNYIVLFGTFFFSQVLFSLAPLVQKEA